VSDKTAPDEFTQPRYLLAMQPVDDSYRVGFPEQDAEELEAHELASIFDRIKVVMESHPEYDCWDISLTDRTRGSD
jgi:hypothetical protein